MPKPEHFPNREIVAPWLARLISVALVGLGTFISILIIALLTHNTGEMWIIASFGATCVLVFGFPAGPFSKPRNVIGGHFLASLIGLTFLSIFGPGWIPMAAATATAVMAMILTDTVHPPAGSNALVIFLGAPGWSFLLFPTLAGACTIMLAATVYWRAVDTIKNSRAPRLADEPES